MKKGRNGRKSLRRLKPTVGCNASKRKKKVYLQAVHCKENVLASKFADSVMNQGIHVT